MSDRIALACSVITILHATNTAILLHEVMGELASRGFNPTEQRRALNAYLGGY